MDPDYRWEVDLRFGELLRFQLYMILVRYRAGLIFGLWVLAGAYMTFQLVSGRTSLDEAWKGLAFAFGAPVLLIAIVAFGTYRTFQQTWKPLLPIRYKVDSSGLSTSMPSIESQVAWSGIEESRVWGGLLLLFINRHCAFILPTRCLGERGGEFRRFVDQRTAR